MFYNQGLGSLLQLLNNVGIYNIASSDNNKQNLFIFSQLSDFVECSTCLYIQSSLFLRS